MAERERKGSSGEEGDNAEYRSVVSRIAALESASKGDRPPVIPLIDPTANVLSLVAAAIERQDDLRGAENKRLNDLRVMETNYQEKLSAAESRRIDALALAETRRIDALIASSQNAVSLDREKTAAQAATLAAAVASSAEALRSQVAATLASTTAQTNSVRDALDERVKKLEQSQYSIGGRDTQRDTERGRSQWTIGTILTIVFGSFSVMGIVIGAIYTLSKLVVK